MLARWHGSTTSDLTVSSGARQTHFPGSPVTAASSRGHRGILCPQVRLRKPEDAQQASCGCQT